MTNLEQSSEENEPPLGTATPPRRNLLQMISGSGIAALGIGTGQVGATKGDHRTSSNSRSFTLLNWNIHHGQGEDGMLNLRRIADLIERANADIVTLQEVDNEFRPRSNCENQPQKLADMLNMRVRFAGNVSSGTCGEETTGQYGTAVMTKRRYPLLKHEHHLLPHEDIGEQRGLQELLVNIRGQKVKIYNTHLQHGTDDQEDGDNLRQWIREKQILEIVDRMESDGLPNCIGGDFNTTPDSDEMGPLFEGYDDAFANGEDVWAPPRLRELDDYYTYPGTHWRHSAPDRRIDYIFTHENRLSIEQATLWEALSSDHLPIFADISVPKTV